MNVDYLPKAECPFDGEGLTVERDHNYKPYYSCCKCKNHFTGDLKKYGRVHFSHGFPIFDKDVNSVE